MSKINWVDGAEIHAYRGQYKIINNIPWVFVSSNGRWYESNHSFSALKNSDDYQINPNISEIGSASEPKESSDWSDEHYNHFYQLTKEDIERGKIKVDAYFVNRMWKINSWEDTGAGFHILKTLPRIANNKNSLKRELVALKKQVDMLCKLHGVDDV